MIKYVQVFVCFLVGVLPSFGQTPYQNALVNQGVLTSNSEALVSTRYECDSTNGGCQAGWNNL